MGVARKPIPFDYKATAAGIAERAKTKEFHLPVLTDEQTILWLDSLRIPEYLAETAYMDSPRYLERGAPDKTRMRYKSMLEEINAWYAAGLISATDHERLTTIQNYSHDHLWALRDEVKTFIPQWVGNGANGVKWLSLRVGGHNTSEYGYQLEQYPDGRIVKTGEYGAFPTSRP